MSRIRVSCSLWALLATIAATPAVAMEEDAEALVSQGVQLRRERRDLEALPLFRWAVERSRTPKNLAQLGTCEQAVGLWVEAEIHLRDALAEIGDPWIQRNEAALRQALTRVQGKLGSIELWGTPAGAQIRVDGQGVAKLPTTQPIRLVEGKRTLAIEALGYCHCDFCADLRPIGQI